MTQHFRGMTLPDDCATVAAYSAAMRQPIAAMLVVLLFAEIAKRYPEPYVMAVGLTPLALVAAEAAWRLMTFPGKA